MVLCSGAFDGLHAGHTRYLTEASRLRPREALCVAIAPDSYIRTAKGRDPFWSQAERAATVLALGVVDRVYGHAEDSPARLIRDLKPQWFVKGTDWRDKLPADILQACQDVGCEIRYVHTPGRHTSEVRR